MTNHLEKTEKLRKHKWPRITRNNQDANGLVGMQNVGVPFVLFAAMKLFCWRWGVRYMDGHMDGSIVMKIANLCFPLQIIISFFKIIFSPKFKG